MRRFSRVSVIFIVKAKEGLQPSLAILIEILLPCSFVLEIRSVTF